MENVNPRMSAWQLLVVVFGVGLLAWMGNKPVPSPPATPLPVASPSPSMQMDTVTVCVQGEVRAPGMYTLPQDARLSNALHAAGGITPMGDDSRVNLAQLLKDGQFIVIPARAAPAALEPARLSLNQASERDLTALPGIGPARARRIVSYRTAHGPFSQVDDLSAVPGIPGPLIESLRPLVEP